MQFGSDNQTGASAKVLEMLCSANAGYTHGYGDDEWTERGIQALREVFETDAEIYFVATGTAANSLALSCMVTPWEIILCHDQAHIISDESTAPEFYTAGARMVPVSKGAGKITPEHIHDYFSVAGDAIPHNSIATALSLSQISEVGLVYTPDELKELCSVAHEKGLQVHMDGARFANALAHLNCTPAELTWKAGVDVLCLGATKCGALCAEAVIFFNKKSASSFIHRRKRAGHLVSKGRMFGAQFVGWLRENHWLELAKKANDQAKKLASTLSTIPEIELVRPTEGNELFLTLPKAMATHLQQEGAEFYEWSQGSLPPNITLRPDQSFIRLVTSFTTEDHHVETFCETAQKFSSKTFS